MFETRHATSNFSNNSEELEIPSTSPDPAIFGQKSKNIFRERKNYFFMLKLCWILNHCSPHRSNNVKFFKMHFLELEMIFSDFRNENHQNC